MSKMAQCLYILLMTAKNQSQYGQNISVHLKYLTEFFQEMVWLREFGVIVHVVLRVEILKKLRVSKKY